MCIIVSFSFRNILANIKIMIRRELNKACEFEGSMYLTEKARDINPQAPRNPRMVKRLRWVFGPKIFCLLYMAMGIKMAS